MHTKLWVAALIRRAQINGAFAILAHRGDAERGDVLVRVRDRHGLVRVWGRDWSPSGREEWTGFVALPLDPSASTPHSPDDSIAEAYVTRRLRADPDLWVVDIEDPEGRPFVA